jgi:hypothetical protein
MSQTPKERWRFRLNGLQKRHDTLLTVVEQMSPPQPFDPHAWSTFSQGWNRELLAWRVRMQLIPQSDRGYRHPAPSPAKRALIGASVALHHCWTAYHHLLDYQRTRPRGLMAGLLTVACSDRAPGRHEARLAAAVADAERQYTLHVEAVSAALAEEQS